MRLSQAIAKKRDLVVHFDGADLKVVYRPLSYTPRQMDEMAAEASASEGRPSRRILETMQKLLITWDLTDEHEVLIPIEGDIDAKDESGKYTHPLYDVPSNVFVAIIGAANEDQQPGGQKASSAS